MSILWATLMFAALSGSTAEVEPADFGTLHYLYEGAVGDQGCAELKPNGLRKRSFVSRYTERLRTVDRWFDERYSSSVLSDALANTYGGPDTIDVRDCLKTAEGKPVFRDTAKFMAKLNQIERNMRKFR